jgi:RNA-directed DNA polymerase
VTQINAGRNTPGVDMLVVKTSKARSELVEQMRSYQPWKARPARRIYIPKAHGKMRPLGIPTVTDRVMQAIVKNALEPYWEVRFEPSTYGFRPGRSCHDAIAKIFSIARPNKRKKWVLDADIEGAFDSISHERLLEAIGGLDPGGRTDQSFGYRVRRRRSKGCREQHHAIHQSSEQRR